MESRKVLATLLVALLAPLVVLLPTPAVASACAAASPTPPASTPGVDLLAEPTSIHWTQATKRLRYGDTGTLTGQVVTTEGAVPNATVHLYRRVGSAWEQVDTTTSDRDKGVFRFCIQPASNTRYRVVHEGNPLYATSEAQRRVGVARRMPDAIRQTGPRTFVLSGTVSPRYDGRVTLERQLCDTCAWQAVRTTATRTGSAWSFAIDVSGLRGTTAWRATIPADSTYIRSTSDRTWRITLD